MPKETVVLTFPLTKLNMRVGCNFPVKVEDLTKENGFSTWRQVHFEKTKTFRALVNDTGEIKEGIMTKEQIETFLLRERNQ